MLPDGFYKLKNLDVSRNNLLSIDFQNDLPALELMDLSGNGLVNLDLPNGLKKLKYLYANKNKLNSFNTTAKFEALEILHLAENKLEELPKAAYTNLQSLYLKGNPLKGYQESLTNGDESGNASEVIGLLRAIFTSGHQPNYRLKLIIVGNGRIGKNLSCKSFERGTMREESDLYAWNFYQRTHKKRLT